MKQLVVVFVGLLLLWGCGGSNSSSTGNVNLQFLSSTLTASRPGRAGTICTATYSRTTDTGLCYTPTKISGIFSEVTLSKTGAVLRPVSWAAEASPASPISLRTRRSI